MIEMMPPEAQEAFNSATDGGLGALSDALAPPADGQGPAIDGTSEALDVAMSESQVQGGGGVSPDDASTHAAHEVETMDDDAVESSEDAPSSDETV